MPRPGAPRDKQSRRFGFDVFGNAGTSLRRRLSQATERPRGRRRKVSDYGRQLTEKQKTKAIYGVDERQFRRLVDEAARQPGPQGEVLLTLLERRLDNVVYRLGFARTRPMARQLVGHGHVLVDGKRLSIPSARVEPGQAIALAEDAAKIPVVIEELASGRPVPEWLSRAAAGASGMVVRAPERRDVDHPIDERLVIGFYSR